MITVLFSYLENIKTEINFKKVRNLIIIVVTIILFSSLLILEVEPNQQLKTFEDALWWSIVTSTTVGYGDIFPVTFRGRIIAILLMVLGIGTFGAFTAEFANLFMRLKNRKELGEMKAGYNDHLVICGWCKIAQEVIVQALNEEEQQKIVLVANIEKDPYPDKENIHFVRGNIDDEVTLKRAGIDTASKAIVLNEDANDSTTVLSVLTIESLNPDIYTVVEVENRQNKKHFVNANVDEIIITNQLNSQLLVRTAFYEGTSNFIEELLSNKNGNEIYMLPLPADDSGIKFIDLLNKYKQEQDIIILGIKRKGEIITNPANDEIINPADELIYIAKDSIM